MIDVWKKLDEDERAQVQSEVEVVDDVFMMLYNHKPLVISALFGRATADYQEEWHRRDPFDFWGHLDLGNRQRVVRLARGFYRESRNYLSGTPPHNAR